MDQPRFLVVGTPRSGTTLVQRLACELPGVAVPAETHFFSDFVWSTPSPPRFPLEAQQLAGWLEDYSRRPYLEGVGLDPSEVHDRLGGRARSFTDIFAAVVEVLGAGAEVVGEKTPAHLLWWRPLCRALPALRLVVVVRDPRAVVASQLALGWSRHPAATAQRWRDDVARALAARRVLGERVMWVTYEDVVADPMAVRTRLAGHLGVAGHRGPAPPGPNGGAAEPVPMFAAWESWKSGATDEVDQSRVDAWRHELSPAVRRQVEAICAPAMARAGYERPPRAPMTALDPAARAHQGRQVLRRLRRGAGIARLSRHL